MSEVQTRLKVTSATVLWTLAILVAGFATWIMFDAMPGINWVLWTLAAGAGLLVFLRNNASVSTPVFWLVLSAVIISGGAAVTAEPFLAAMICLAVIFLLALAMLLSTDMRIERLTAGLTIVAPAVAFGLALAESVRRAVDALHIVRSPQRRAALRGIAITIPVIVIFGLLLSTADPIFANWREAIDHLLSSWAFIPRTIFFIGMLAIVLGAFGYAARGETDVPFGIGAALPPTDRNRWLGSTERLILMAGVALLFWTFLAVQLSYLFGNLPSVTGSGMTFAEYAQRGFGELTVVASLSALLIIVSERYGEADHRRKLLLSLTIAVIVAVLFLLGSAFNRVLLYEEAYGFTTARLYAQAYMIIVAVSLIFLARETMGELNPTRLFLRAGITAVLTFIGLIYWNHEAWIASRNIDLYRKTGKLDTVYLTRDLSADAIPTIMTRLPTLSEPARSQLLAAVKLRYLKPRAYRWFEWNYRRARAHDVLTGV